AEKKAEAERIAAEKAAAAKAKAEEDARIAAEKMAEAERIAKEKAAAAKAKAEEEAAARAKAEEDARIAAEKKAEAERIAAEKAAAAMIKAEEEARQKKLELKVQHEVIRNTILENIVGWRHSTYLTISGVGRYTEYPSLSVEYLGGYRFNNTFFVGVGTGILFHFRGNRNLVNIPLYANAKAYIGKYRLQPYFSLSVGGNFSTKRTYDDVFEVGTSQFFVTPGIGLDVRFKSGSAISLQAGLQLITTPTDHWAEIIGEGVQYHISYPLKPGFQVQIGYTF
ncbi:MAG: hypothetical protein IJB03_00320, partial [Alistipes sp.]|nr:hypothetical protein [Alistipes sp.]